MTTSRKPAVLILNIATLIGSLAGKVARGAAYTLGAWLMLQLLGVNLP